LVGTIGQKPLLKLKFLSLIICFKGLLLKPKKSIDWVGKNNLVEQKVQPHTI